jgi:hypothetical protein
MPSYTCAMTPPPGRTRPESKHERRDRLGRDRPKVGPTAWSLYNALLGFPDNLSTSCFLNDRRSAPALRACAAGVWPAKAGGSSTLPVWPLDGSYHVLDVAAGVALRPLVQLFSAPLGLLAGGESTYLMLLKRQTPWACGSPPAWPEELPWWSWRWTRGYTLVTSHLTALEKNSANFSC